jgi:hypothetical protein
MTRPLFAAALALALMQPAVAEAQQKGKKSIWHTDYSRARAEAKRAGKILFVVFRCQP